MGKIIFTIFTLFLSSGLIAEKIRIEIKLSIPEEGYIHSADFEVRSNNGKRHVEDIDCDSINSQLKSCHLEINLPAGFYLLKGWHNGSYNKDQENMPASYNVKVFSLNHGRPQNLSGQLKATGVFAGRCARGRHCSSIGSFVVK